MFIAQLSSDAAQILLPGAGWRDSAGLRTRCPVLRQCALIQPQRSRFERAAVVARRAEEMTKALAGLRLERFALLVRFRSVQRAETAVRCRSDDVSVRVRSQNYLARADRLLPNALPHARHRIRRSIRFFKQLGSVSSWIRLLGCRFYFIGHSFLYFFLGSLFAYSIVNRLLPSITQAQKRNKLLAGARHPFVQRMHCADRRSWADGGEDRDCAAARSARQVLRGAARDQPELKLCLVVQRRDHPAATSRQIRRFPCARRSH